MFSGIIEALAEVVEIRADRQNKDFTLRAPFASELKIDQSVAHNGVCLTVVAIDGDRYTVTAMKETLDRSNLGLLRAGDLVNVERSMRPEALLDGHIVQGHVDQTARCTAREEAGGSWYFTFEYEPQGGGLTTVEKGSVAVNGVSLTRPRRRSAWRSSPTPSNTPTSIRSAWGRSSTSNSTSWASISPALWRTT